MFTTEETNQKKWPLLIAMALALAMVFLDQTAVPISLPQIQRDFNTTPLMLQWIVNAYLLALAVMIIFGGKIGDIIGHRKTFTYGLIVFIFASISSAMAPHAYWIVFSRALQGIGGAFMVPAISVIVISSFPIEQRGKTMGTVAGLAATFLVCGPLLGGTLTQFLSWRWVFWLNLPLSLICLILTLKYVPKKLFEDQQKTPLDWQGFILSTIGLISLVFALMEGASIGWGSPIILSSFILAIITLTIFVFHQKHKKYPLIQLNIFNNANFRAAVITLLLIQAILISTIFWTIYNQDVLGFQPAIAGLLSMPGVLPTLITPFIGGRLYDRFGPRLPVTLGCMGIAIGTLWVGFFAYWENYWYLLPGFILFGSSVPLIMGSSLTTAVSSVAANQRGVASGLSSGARQLGGAVGLAVIGSLLFNLNQWKLKNSLANLHLFLSKTAYGKIDGILAGTPSGKQFLATLQPPQATALMNAVKHSYIFAFQGAMFLAAGIAFIAVMTAMKLPNSSLFSSNKPVSTKRPKSP